MKKVTFFLSALLICRISIYAQADIDSLKQVSLNEVIVSAFRVGQNAPIAYSDMNEKQIKNDNTGKNLPYVLQLLPSVVAYSEGGTPIGNTSLRIRGTDATRINVTLNGMPLNNPESQETFWVNLPDLSSSLQSIQVQRGTGTATNGTAAFGASISLRTTASRPEAYGEASTAIGSYNAFISSVAAGTGVMKNGLSFDGHFSRTTGDGYIRNGKVDHRSGNISLSHYTDKQLIRIFYMTGIQHTGITWNGISPEDIKKYGYRYNDAGQYKDDAGNIHYYDNETDNYYSNIVQAIYTRYQTQRLTLNANFSYNNGYGYTDSYKANKKFSDFGLPSQIIKGVQYKRSDFIRKKYLSNNFYTGNFNLNYTTDKLNLSAGSMYSYYDGSHYGKLPWIKYNPSQNISPNYKWYTENDWKSDFNIFTKAEYNPINNLTLFGEAQYRYVDFRIKGIDDDFSDITQNKYYSFFNPKAGISFRFLSHNEIYSSFGISNREPIRSDLKDIEKHIKPERLYDYEFGYRHASSNISFEANFYYMNYKDQMVQTGKMTPSGYKLQENVPHSYRMGVELSAAYTPVRWLRLDANTTLSRNRIKNYTKYYTTFYNAVDYKELTKEDADKQIKEYIGNTNISYSPDVVGSGIITILPFKKASLSFIGKYVGKMYYDNTSDNDYRLDDYFVTNIAAGYTFKTQKVGEIDFQFFINNIFDKRYYGHATVDVSKFLDGSSDSVYQRLFPQAPCNIMARVGIRF